MDPNNVTYLKSKIKQQNTKVTDICIFSTCGQYSVKKLAIDRNKCEGIFLKMSFCVQFSIPKANSKLVKKNRPIALDKIFKAVEMFAFQ